MFGCSVCVFSQHGFVVWEGLRENKIFVLSFVLIDSFVLAFNCDACKGPLVICNLSNSLHLSLFWPEPLRRRVAVRRVLHLTLMVRC